MAFRGVVLLTGAVYAARQRLDTVRKQGQDVQQPLYRPGSVQDAWDNHFAAFGGKDVERILLDYDDRSEIRVYDVSNPGEVHLASDMQSIQKVFEGLFADLEDRSQLEVPLLHVSGGDDEFSHDGRGSSGKGGGDIIGTTGQVFLVWNSPTDSFYNCTDTFIFDRSFKIRRQNIVIKTSVETAVAEVPVDSSAGHVAALRQGNRRKIMESYSESSVVRVFDNTARSTTTYQGMGEIRHFIHTYVRKISPSMDLKLIEVDRFQIFLVWTARDGGYTEGTETLILDYFGNIISHNVVLTTNDASGVSIQVTEP